MQSQTQFCNYLLCKFTTLIPHLSTLQFTKSHDLFILRRPITLPATQVHQCPSSPRYQSSGLSSWQVGRRSWRKFHSFSGPFRSKVFTLSTAHMIGCWSTRTTHDSSIHSAIFFCRCMVSSIYVRILFVRTRFSIHSNKIDSSIYT